MKSNASVHTKAAGFSLVELMVALALGLLLIIAMSAIYLSTKTAFSRQHQLSSIQQNVRTAFEYLANDARMVGHLGCYTGRSTAPNCTGSGLCNPLSTTSIATNYALGIEGYDYKNTTAGAYTLSSASPPDSTTVTDWETNTAAVGVNTIPITTIAGSGAGDGLTPGSDVLVVRTVSGAPVRLSANTTAAAPTLSIENIPSGKCSDGTTNKVSGFCPKSHGLIASCTNARVFQVTNAPITAPTLTMAASLGGDPIYSTTGAEVFPLQTIVYYVKKSSSGSTTSLYRRTFDGDNANGLEEELIEGVENLQFTYGRDTSVPPDGAIDDYKLAKEVADWSTVVAVRMGVLLRSTEPLGADLHVANSAPVNGVDITFPGGTKYDRRVFTTTVAVRNKIAYF